MIKVLIIILLLSVSALSQPIINKVEPSNWWKGMKHNKIQLMVYGEDLNDCKASFSSKNIIISKIHNAESNKYSFIDIEIKKNIQPGKYLLTLEKNGQKTSYNYEIKERIKDSKRFQGFNNNDAVYLLVPDRFANGDTSNDNIPGYKDKLKPDGVISRHGGDLKGIINKLDYIKELGVTTLWLTPVVENNVGISYHGYAATDFYNIDPRHGSNSTYVEMVNKAHEKGLKVILDHVSNHFGIDHPWMKNLPFSSWINGTAKDHLSAKHYKMVFADSYADSSSMFNVTKGWFADSMPDLNQRNPYVAAYIIQNTIWWIETAGLDGIREDTYPYNDQKFLASWAKEVLSEYPTINIVGEIWTGDVPFLATFQRNSFNKKDFDSNLPALIDFGFRDAIYSYLTGKGFNPFYETIAKDFIYADPENLMIFIDNHDIARVMFYSNSDVHKVKNAMQLLLTTRGIPQFLYGTELGMKGSEEHGELRADFPGGFPNSSRNAFSKEGRNEFENDIYNFSSKLLNLRKEYKALANGKFTHYPPEKDAYVYYKEAGQEKILCVVTDNQYLKLNLDNYKEIIKDAKEVKNLMTNEIFDVSSNKEIPLNKEGNIFLIK